MNKSFKDTLLIVSLLLNVAHAQFKCDTVTIKPVLVLSCSSWHSNGSLESAYELKNGKFQGIYRSWYRDKNIENIFRYDSGCLIDSGYSYFENGRLKVISKNNGCGKKGWSVSFFKNGDTSSFGTPQFFHSFYPSGKHRIKVYYNTSGLKHGLSESWREDGTRKDSSVFNNGKLIESRAYYATGKPRYWEKYKGEYIVNKKVFPDGGTIENPFNPLIEGFYYHPKAGKIISHLENGNGKAIYYDENGLSPDTCEYVNGEEVKR